MRSPLFITAEGIDDWIGPRKFSTAEAVGVLRRHWESPELACEVESVTKSFTDAKRAKKLAERQKQLAARRDVRAECSS